MSNKNGPSHVVVDGSNIATEGRSLPSLKQLQEAVMGFMDEYPDAAITVVVDATFGHRIDKSESKEFEAGISNNELVAPPAGAVGRGDAFVLGIADKAGASVLSNDSFQEFHADYEWLFDEGRLIGGKPVPHVGWVWVDRVPVRGPVSRKATGGRRGRGGSSGGGRSRAKSDETVRTGSKEASGPMPVPKGPPPVTKAAAKKSTSRKSASRNEATERSEEETASSGGRERGGRRSAPKSQDPVNDLMPFLEFVEHHPVGSTIEGTVDAYSSHGAYVTVGETGVRAYVPLRLMANPTPRSAKQVMKMGDDVSLVVVSFAAARRSIDCAVPDLAEAAIEAAGADPDGDVEASVDSGADVQEAAPTKMAAAKRGGRKKAAAKKTPAKKAAATKKTAAKKSAAKKSAAKKSAAEKPAAKKPAAKTAAKKAPAKKTAAKKTAAKKAAAKTTAKKAAATQRPTAKAATKKTPAKKAAAKKAAARTTTSKKKAAAKKAATKKDS